MASYFITKTIEELEKIAKTYKTQLAESLIEDKMLGKYEIADASKDEFYNITTFILNATIKDSKAIDAAETANSKFFSEKLKKYFEDQLSLDDIVALRRFVKDFNQDIADYIYTNAYSYIYGLTTIDEEMAIDSVFYRIVNHIKEKIQDLVDLAIEKNLLTEEKSIREWFGLDHETALIEVDLSTFFSSYFNRSKIVESIILLSIISYLNNTETGSTNVGTLLMEFNSTEYIASRNPSLCLNNETFYLNPNSNRNETYTFGSENISITNIENNEDKKRDISYRTDGTVAYRRTINKIKIKDDNENIFFEIPVNITEIKGTLNNNDFTIGGGEIENIIDIFSNINLNNITNYSTLAKELYSNLFGFINQLKTDLDLATLTEEQFRTYSNIINYFYDDINLFPGLFTDIKKFSKLYYQKDTIQDYIRYSPITETSSDPKTYANTFEGTCAKDGQQLLFIDAKEAVIDLTKVTSAPENTADGFISLFPSSGITDSNYQEYRLTYTVLYKELNSVLREVSYIDNQELIFSRLLDKEGKEKLFATNIGEISFYPAIDTIYRGYTEEDELLTLVTEFYRYKYYYSNMYAARAMPESSLIGYYIGDNSDDTLFLNNYGYKAQEKIEIANFIEIYKTTREYYYKVLLNKAFVQDSDYSLYEKLMITFIALDRFLTSKIENLRNPDYFTAKDIFNFLESYGLGILNNERFNFIIAEKDFKLNIVKYFNDLVRLKGSKDVISILLNVFEVGDITMEIKKFLILEKQYHDYKSSISSLAKSGDNNIRFIEVPYFSENGTREILNAINTGNDIDYNLFISNDEYWNATNVPESDLLELGINVAETKYLGLMLSENVYRRFFLSRYVFSTINYLYKKLLDKTDPNNILYSTKIDTGDLFGEISLYDFIEVIRVYYATVIKLYEQYQKTLGSTEDADPAPTKFYGINDTIDWSFLEGTGEFLENNIFNYSIVDSEFLNSERKETKEDPISKTEFKKYNIFKFKDPEEWINFDTSTGTGNLGYEYKKYDYTQYTDVATQLKDVLFSTHKTTFGKEDVNNIYKNSGNYVIELFENLNLLRIDNTNHDLWMYILSTYFDKNYTTPVNSSTYIPSGTDLNYKDLYYKVIEKIMKLPIDYFDGLMTTKANPELYHNKQFEELIKLIMNNVYMTETDPLSIGEITIESESSVDLSEAEGYLADVSTTIPTTSNEELLITKITEYSEKLLLALNSLQTIFSSEAYMTFYLTLKAQEQQTLEFVRTTVEVFLSYTTELYYTIYRKTFNTPSETIPFSEDIQHILETKQMDLVFYDEKLDVELVEEGGE